MRYLLLCFNYPPDIGAGAFRMSAFVEELARQIGPGDRIDVITPLPNRYETWTPAAAEIETGPNVTIRRVRIPRHQSGFLDQAKAFSVYFLKTLALIRGERYDAVFATSSRLFTAALGMVAARWKRAPLYLDIRDIFTSTIDSMFKTSRLRLPALALFRPLERLVLSSAKRVNVVSEGFPPLLAWLPRERVAFHPNGIDDEFLENDFTKPAGGRPVVTYAGNVGEGQGLERILPEMARRHPGTVFRVIGGGGRMEALRAACAGFANVETLPPESRESIIERYKQSDYLFLHLNDYEAFDHVLPSKIFEYGATGKHVIAGVRGYAADFIRRHLPDSLVFPPTDVEAFERMFRDWNPQAADREEFKRSFARVRIVRELAADFLASVRGGRGDPPAGRAR